MLSARTEDEKWRRQAVAGTRRSCVNYGLSQASSLGSTRSYMLFGAGGGQGQQRAESDRECGYPDTAA